MRFLKLATLAATGLGLAACSTVEDIASYDIAGGTLSAIGVTSPNRERPEDPKPRGPLVVPGTTDLPAPRESTALDDPAWPKDPEATEEEQERVAQEKRVAYWERFGSDQQPRQLRPDELARDADVPRLPDARPDSFQQSMITSNEPNRRISTVELNRQNELALELERQQNGMEGGQTRRRYLTDPPEGYSQLSGEDYEGKDELLANRPEKKRTGLGRFLPF